MSDKQKFFICERCGNMVGTIHIKDAPIVCCGEDMKGLVPNTVDASKEKHLPVVNLSGNTINVTVGSAAHPMEEKHNIDFIYVETEQGGQRKGLKVGAEPKANFTFIDDKPVAVYAYCNLHGLWKTDL